MGMDIRPPNVTGWANAPNGMSAGNRSLIRTPSHSTGAVGSIEGISVEQVQTSAAEKWPGRSEPVDTSRLETFTSRKVDPAPPRTVSKRRAPHFAPRGTPCLLQVKGQHRRQVRRRIATPMSRHGTECVSGARWAGSGVVRRGTARSCASGGPASNRAYRGGRKAGTGRAQRATVQSRGWSERRDRSIVSFRMARADRGALACAAEDLPADWPLAGTRSR
jgi:hypothetical protein